MKKALLLLLPFSLYAADDTQVCTMVINAINEFAIAGLNPFLTINTAVAGIEPTSATSSGITYAFTTNDGNDKKVTGKINIIMPTSTSLSLELSAPPVGGTSAGLVALTNIDQNLVTGIPDQKIGSSVAMTYTFGATTAAGTQTAFARTATLTFLNN